VVASQVGSHQEDQKFSKVHYYNVLLNDNLHIEEYTSLILCLYLSPTICLSLIHTFYFLDFDDENEMLPDGQ